MIPTDDSAIASTTALIPRPDSRLARDRALHPAAARTAGDHRPCGTQRLASGPDIQPTCEFLLDYEEDEDEEGTSRRRKPWRYRWPDDIRDEVLARLLALNGQRAEEERLAGVANEQGKQKRDGKKRKLTAIGGQLGFA